VEQLPNTSLGYAYNNDLQVSQLSYAGGVVNYGYDDDSLLARAGAFEFNSLRGIAGRTYEYSIEDHLLTAGDTTYQYDLDGFLITRTRGTEVTHYAYSSRGELLSVLLPDGLLIQYRHDPLGRRIAKLVSGTVAEKYLWQGLTRLLAVYDATDNLLMRFEYADGRMPLAMTADGDTYYLAYDQVGSLRAVANAEGNVVKRIDYDSFGNMIADTNPLFESHSALPGASTIETQALSASASVTMTPPPVAGPQRIP
jgi:YD repeat-containing protein